MRSLPLKDIVERDKNTQYKEETTTFLSYANMVNVLNPSMIQFHALDELHVILKISEGHIHAHWHTRYEFPHLLSEILTFIKMNTRGGLGTKSVGLEGISLGRNTVQFQNGLNTAPTFKMSTTVNKKTHPSEIGDPHFATKAIHVGNNADRWNSGSVVTPIFMSAKYRQPPSGQGEFVYSRDGNPSRQSVEISIAALENGKHAFCFASGTAALDSVIHLLKPRDHIICDDGIFGDTDTYFRNITRRLHMELSLVDTSDLDAVRNSIKSNTALIWIETPSNPLMKLTDLAGIRTVLDESQREILFVVDNTFLSPYFQRPLNFGADIVIEALSHYVNGHNDVKMGAVATNRDDITDKFISMQRFVGSVPSPVDCYMMQRSIKTIALRMQEHMRNGLAVARFLEGHPCVEKVIHPGLPTHPQHQLSLKQTSGSSGILSFYIKGGLEESNKFLSAIKIFNKAGSLSGCESLANLPIRTTHENTSREHLNIIGITDSLIRLSVGIEDIEDILKDLNQALLIAVKDKLSEQTV